MSDRESKPDGRSRTFDFRGPVTGSTFRDVGSTADEFFVAEAPASDLEFEDITHRPAHAPGDGRWNWAKIGAIATALTIPVAVVLAIIFH